MLLSKEEIKKKIKNLAITKYLKQSKMLSIFITKHKEKT
jgi:hypothetical protein